jgi:cation diffusion facilitator family transporter
MTTDALAARALDPAERAALIRRGQLYSRLTLAYNTLEGVAALVTGVMAGSIALVGFGVDSVIEVVSSVAALWRLRVDVHEHHRAHAERVALRIIGICFLMLALFIVLDAGRSLWTRQVPRKTWPGIIVAALSVIVMPLLVRAKRRVARGLGSRALEADASQTNLCAYLSAIVLIGLALNAAFGWWWADPIAGLLMTPIIVREGLEGVRGEAACDDCRPAR